MPVEKEPDSISRRSFLKQSVSGCAGVLVAKELLSAEARGAAKGNEAKKDSGTAMIEVPFGRESECDSGSSASVDEAVVCFETCSR